MNSPFISVVIPVYNKATYVQRALSSVVNQTYQDFEIVVVNDGSTDDSVEKVQAIHDPRIRLITQSNAGVSSARNKGIAESQGTFIAFLDADDEWKEKFLEYIILLHQEYPRAQMMATSFEFVRDKEIVLKLFALPKRSLLSLHAYVDCCVKKGSPMCTSSTVVSKTLAQEVGCFQIGQSYGEDLDFWFRLIEKAPLAYYNSPQAKYWIGLPNSLCIATRQLEEKPLLQSLEKRLSEGNLLISDRQVFINYIAWRNFLAFEASLLKRDRRCAHRLLISSWRSKIMRRRFIISYIKSFVPKSIIISIKLVIIKMAIFHGKG
jgi:glycosyltransferase involved in cell wall biosynthesis